MIIRKRTTNCLFQTCVHFNTNDTKFHQAMRKKRTQSRKRRPIARTIRMVLCV